MDGRRVTQCVLAYNESPRSAACLHGQRCVWKRVDVEYVCHFEPVVLRAVLMFNTKRNANVRALFSVRAPTSSVFLARLHSSLQEFSSNGEVSARDKSIIVWIELDRAA